MPWNDATESVIAAGGQVNVAPLGTALPTTPTGALNAAFVGLGYISEDGLTLNGSKNIEEFMAFQSADPIRREVTARNLKVAFALLQWNESTVPFAFGGGSIVSVSGGYRFDPPEAEDGIDERAMVVDWNDGSESHRLVIARGSVTSEVETQLQRAAMAELPIEFDALKPDTGRTWNYFTSSDAFVAGS